MRYQTAVFDLDGTLLNTLDDLTASVNAALSSASMPLRTKEEVRQFVGNGIGLLMKRAVPANTPQQEYDRVFECLLRTLSGALQRPYHSISWDFIHAFGASAVRRSFGDCFQ